MMASYEEWLATVPVEITGDPLWRMEGYRFALFASDLAWRDVCKLAQDKRTLEVADQLFRGWLCTRQHFRGFQPPIGQ